MSLLESRGLLEVPNEVTRLDQGAVTAEGLVSEEGWGSAGAWVERADYTCSRKLCFLGPKNWGPGDL